ncbi:CHAT domain-containing protein [Sphaerisporangium sp. NPDC088356]|uniref:CHAT domain-containing protein n=1 Tax=Sphaerisporangium sp. NPDC088356 TaxID=3154871 RepID=UPI003443BEDA
MDEAVLARIYACVRAYQEEGHADGLFSEEALADAERLRGSSEPEALRARAWYHWCRYEADGELADLAVAVEASDLLREADPEARPYVLGHALDHLDGRAAGEEPELLTDGEEAAWAGLFFSLGGACGEMFTATQDLTQVNRAVLAMDTALGLLGEADTATLPATVMLGRFLSVRGQATDDREDLEAAAGRLGDALRLAPADHPFRSGIHLFLCGALAHAYLLDQRAETAAALAEVFVTALGEVPRDNPDWTAIAELGRGIAGDAGDAGVALARVAVAARPVGDPERPVALYVLGTRLAVHATAGGSADDSVRAVTALREMVALDTGVIEVRVLGRTMLSLCLAQAFEMTGDIELPPEAVAMAREALAAGPPTPELRLFCVLNLGTALSHSYHALGRRDHLEELIGLLGRTDLDSPDGARGLYVLAGGYYDRYQVDGSKEDLERAVSCGRRAVAAIPGGDPGLSDALGNLGNALLLRSRLTGSATDLDEAVALYRRAVQVTPEGHANRPGVCLNLGGGLRERYLRSGSPSDLEDAMALTREALGLAVPGSPAWHLSQSTLGAALADHHSLSGSRAELDEAIIRLRAAVDAMREGALDRPSALNLLGTTLHSRFELTGSGDDLDAAIASYRSVLAATAPASPQHLTSSGNLGGVLESRYWRTKDRADLDEAVAVLVRAEEVAARGDDNSPVILTNLAKALSTRYLAFDDLADLDRAVSTARAAYEALPPGSIRRARYLGGWGSLLATRAERRGDAADLDQAIEALREADANLAPAEPSRAHQLGGRANALLERHARTGARADYEEAVATLRVAAELATCPAHMRMRAARMWAGAAGQAGDMASALEALEHAVRLMPLLAWRGIPRADQEGRLEELSWLAADAAALAVEAGRPERAVELLEHGRGVLWAQLLETRGDLGDLRAAHPDLAGRLEELRAALEAGDGPAREVGADRALLAGEWDDLVARIRTLAGFEDFLRPPAFARLVTAASDGPVVLVNVSARRCDALVLAGGGVTVCPLPGLRAEDVVEWANSLLRLFLRPPANLLENVAAHQRANDLLRWLGANVTAPVLAVTRDAPRVWWCPTGPLALLPLHAAVDPSTGECVLDRVVSSYTPAIRTLIDARARPASAARPRRTLLVAMAHTPGAPDLAVRPEIDALTGLLGDRCTLLEDAVVADVRDRLDGHPWVHLACHGLQDARRPSRSGVVLRDGMLTVLDIAGMRLPDAELAFLSACQTAATGSALTDEAIHLAAALQVVGFRHVVATLWPVYDEIAPELARLFYQRLAGEPDASDAAETLNHAVRRLRDAGNAALPGIWAPYIHVGP